MIMVASTGSTQSSGDVAYQFSLIDLKMKDINTETKKIKYEDDFSNQDSKLKFNFSALKDRFITELTAQYPDLNPTDIQNLAGSLVDISRGFDDHFQALAALGITAASFTSNEITQLVNACLSKDQKTGLPVRQDNVATAATSMLDCLNNKVRSVFKKSTNPKIHALFDLYQQGKLGKSLLDVAKFYGLNKDDITPKLLQKPNLLAHIFLYFNGNPALSAQYRQFFLEVASDFVENAQLYDLFTCAEKTGKWDEAIKFVTQMTHLKMQAPNTYTATLRFLSTNTRCFDALLKFEGGSAKSAFALISWITDWKSNNVAACSTDPELQQKEREKENLAVNEDNFNALCARGRPADSTVNTLEEQLVEEISAIENEKDRNKRAQALRVPVWLLGNSTPLISQ